MARSIERLQIQALGELHAREAQLEFNIENVDALEIVAMYFDHTSFQYEQIALNAGFYTRQHAMVEGMKSIIKANIQVELDKVRAEIDAIGSPVAKVERALNLDATTEQQEAA